MKILILSFSVLFVLNTYGQKLKKERAGRVSYIMPPADYQLQAFKTFILETNEPQPQYAEKIASDIRKSATIKGFKKVWGETPYDFVLSISFANNRFKATKYVEENLAEGTYYKGKIPYSSLVTVKVLLKDGTEIYSKSEILTEYNTTKVVKTKSEVDQIVKVNRPGWEGSYFKLTTAKEMKLVEDQFCFVEQSIYTKLFEVKDKKGDYANFNGAAEKIVLAVQGQDENGKINDGAKKVMNEVINDLIAIKAKVELDNKKALWNKDNVVAIYYNLGLAYFLIEDYENALDQFKIAEKIDVMAILMIGTYTEALDKLVLRLKANN